MLKYRDIVHNFISFGKSKTAGNSLLNYHIKQELSMARLFSSPMCDIASRRDCVVANWIASCSWLWSWLSSTLFLGLPVHPRHTHSSHDQQRHEGTRAKSAMTEGNLGHKVGIEHGQKEWGEKDRHWRQSSEDPLIAHCDDNNDSNTYRHPVDHEQDREEINHSYGHENTAVRLLHIIS